MMKSRRRILCRAESVLMFTSRARRCTCHIQLKLGRRTVSQMMLTVLVVLAAHCRALESATCSGEPLSQLSFNQARVAVASFPLTVGISFGLHHRHCKGSARVLVPMVSTNSCDPLYCTA